MVQKDFKGLDFQRKVNAVNGNRGLNRCRVNFFLLVSGFVVCVSGLIIQIHYHVGQAADSSAVLLLDREAWRSVHVWVSSGFVFVVACHIRTHRKWYKNIYRRGASRKSRPTVILTCLMLVTAVSGFVPGLLSCFDRSPFLRTVIVEVHDKVALLFLAVLFFHTLKRRKGFANATGNKLYPDNR